MLNNNTLFSLLMVVPYYSHSNPIAIPYRTDVADVSSDEWLQVHTPLITAADCEGAGEMRLNWSIDRCVRNGIFMGNMMIFMRKTMTFMRTMMSLWGTWWFLWASDSFLWGKMMITRGILGEFSSPQNPLRFQVTTMMMDAEKDGKPLPMVGGKADARDTMRQLALVVSMLSHFVDLNSLWIWYELQKNGLFFPRETTTSFCKGYLRRAQVFSDCSILPSEITGWYL